MIWRASLEDIKKGFVYEPGPEEYVCLVCGERFTKGYIYPTGERLADAARAVRLHVAEQHRSMFDYLLEIDKKYTGLTDHQKDVLRLFQRGCSDREIAERLNTGSTSTVRNHRFILREKEKQAKVLLAIMELLKEREPGETRRSKTTPDSTGLSEADKVRQLYFKDGADGALSRFPKKHQHRLIVLEQLANRFEPGREYTEKEVNTVLHEAFHDHVTLRRCLVDYGFLNRQADGSRYWSKTSS